MEMRQLQMQEQSIKAKYLPQQKEEEEKEQDFPCETSDELNETTPELNNTTSQSLGQSGEIPSIEISYTQN